MAYMYGIYAIHMEAGRVFVVLILSFLLNVGSRHWTQAVSRTSPKVAFENAILSGHADPHLKSQQAGA